MQLSKVVEKMPALLPRLLSFIIKNVSHLVFLTHPMKRAIRTSINWAEISIDAGAGLIQLFFMFKEMHKNLKKRKRMNCVSRQIT